MERTTTSDEAESGETRERIIEAAMGLFADSGYEGCSVQSLARAVGIKAASLYAHFPGKEAIFDAALEAAIERWKAIVDSAFAGAAGETDLEEGLSIILSRFLEVMAGSTAYRFWTRVYVFPPSHLTAERLEGLGKLDGAFAARLRAACAERVGASAAKSALDGFAASLTHFMMGILVNSMGRVPPETEIRAGVSLLSRGFRAGANQKKGR